MSRRCSLSCIGSLGGILVGFWFARQQRVAAVFDPYVKAANALPRIVLAPIFTLWFGLGIWSKVALGVTLVFFIVFFNVYQGVKEVSPTVLANARMLGMSERQLMRHVYWPSALSWMFSSLHISVGFAVVGAVVGEYLGSAAGLGYIILQAEMTFDIAGVFAGMFVLAAFVLVIDFMVTLVERRLLVWRPVAAETRHLICLPAADGLLYRAHRNAVPLRRAAGTTGRMSMIAAFTRRAASTLAALILMSGLAFAQTKVTMAIGGAACLCYLPTVLAQQLGEYDKAGVKVEMVDFKGGSQALTAVLGGSADVVSGYFDHCVNLAAKNQHMQSFVVYDRYPGLALVVSPKSTNDIKSVKDLANKKVGVSAPGSSTHHYPEISADEERRRSELGRRDRRRARRHRGRRDGAGQYRGRGHARSGGDAACRARTRTCAFCRIRARRRTRSTCSAANIRAARSTQRWSGSRRIQKRRRR